MAGLGQLWDEIKTEAGICFLTFVLPLWFLVNTCTAQAGRESELIKSLILSLCAIPTSALKSAKPVICLI